MGQGCWRPLFVVVAVVPAAAKVHQVFAEQYFKEAQALCERTAAVSGASRRAGRWRSRTPPPERSQRASRRRLVTVPAARLRESPGSVGRDHVVRYNWQPIPRMIRGSAGSRSCTSCLIASSYASG